MENLLIEVEKYVSTLLRRELSTDYIYHNLSHTNRVVKSTETLIEGENVTGIDAENLKIAAWLHDIGHINGSENHEESSVELAVTFLKDQNVGKEKVKQISSLILATKMDYEPQNLSEQIIRDADCSHFAKKNFYDVSELLRAEWEITNIKSFSNIEWIEENISFLRKHHQFYTNFAINNWQAGKDKNLASLLKTLKKLNQDEKKNKKKDEEFALKKHKAKIPERGIETMFRVTLRNHISLSEIADTKANILLSVNAIVLSLILSNLVSKLDNNPYLFWPTVIFVLFTVLSMSLSVLATRPNVTSGKFTKEDVKNKKVNLLFFGNFHKMSLEDFEWAMGEMMQDKDYLYSSMKKDLYFLGKVLDRKYKILRLTYSIFMIGIITTVLAFAIALQYA